MAAATVTISRGANQHFEACTSDKLADLCKTRFFTGERAITIETGGLLAQTKEIARLTGYHTFKLLDAFLLDQAANRVRIQVRDHLTRKKLNNDLVCATGEQKAEILTKLGRLDNSSKLYQASLWLRITESVLFLTGTALAFAPKVFTKISAFGIKAMGIAASCCSLIFMGVFFAIARSIELHHDRKAMKATEAVMDDLQQKINSSNGVEHNLYKLRMDALQRVTYMSQKLEFCQKIFDTIVTTAGYLTAGIAIAMGAAIGNYFLVCALSVVVMSVVLSIIHNSIWAVNKSAHNSEARNWIDQIPENTRLSDEFLGQIAKDRQILDENGKICAARVNNLDMVLWLKGEVFGPV